MYLLPDKTFYISIDWCTFIFDSCSISEAFQIFGFPFEPSMFSEFVKHRTQFTLEESFTWRLNGVSVGVGFSQLANRQLDSDDRNIFNVVFDRVRFDISGTGMSYLRSVYLRQHGYTNYISYDESLLYVLSGLNSAQRGHCTRLDIALDQVNFPRPILDEICSYLIHGGRVGVKGTLKHEVHKSSRGCTAYLGSSASDKRMRIYDKYAESTVTDGIWKPNKTCPFFDHSPHDIHSWIRFEVQLRNKAAQLFIPELRSDDNFLRSPLKFIKYIYKCFYMQADFWREFWTPIQESPESILHNPHFVQFETKPEEIKRIVETRTSLTLLEYVLLYGFDALKLTLESYFIFIQSGSNPRSTLAFASHIGQCGHSLKTLPFAYYDEEFGIYRIKKE